MINIKKQIENNDTSLYGKKNLDDNIAMLYHENSKLYKYSLRVQGERIGKFTGSEYILKRANNPYKIYPNSEIIKLNEFINNNESDFLCVLRNRRSTRVYDNNYKISLDYISSILYQSYGITGFNQEWNTNARNAPSAGGLYPLELYVVILNATIENGIYHYNVIDNTLELICKGNFNDELNNYIQAAPYVELEEANCVIICTGMIERQSIKYGERAYRFMLQESGMVSLNISLIAEYLGVGSCILGGYHDDNINNLLKIDGVFETALSIITIGGKIK